MKICVATLQGNHSGAPLTPVWQVQTTNDTILLKGRIILQFSVSTNKATCLLLWQHIIDISIISLS